VDKASLDWLGFDAWQFCLDYTLYKRDGEVAALTRQTLTVAQNIQLKTRSSSLRNETFDYKICIHEYMNYR
jgi:hypothetical protein